MPWTTAATRKVVSGFSRSSRTVHGQVAQGGGEEEQAAPRIHSGGFQGKEEGGGGGRKQSKGNRARTKQEGDGRKGKGIRLTTAVVVV